MTLPSDLTGKDNYFEDFVVGAVMRHARGKTIEAARQLMYHVCSAIDTGTRCDLEAGMVKYFAAEMSERVTSEGLQIHGGAGYTKLYPAERYWRDARLTKIFEGTSEIQQRIISDALLGKPTRPKSARSNDGL